MEREEYVEAADRARETRTPFERLVIMEQTKKMIRGSQN